MTLTILSSQDLNPDKIHSYWIVAPYWIEGSLLQSRIFPRCYRTFPSIEQIFSNYLSENEK